MEKLGRRNGVLREILWGITVLQNRLIHIGKNSHLFQVEGQRGRALTLTGAGYVSGIT